MTSFENLLDAKRDKILTAWKKRILDSYPSVSGAAFGRKKDRSRNPVGGAIEEGTEAIATVLFNGGGREKLAAAVDGLVRMRAVQDFTPSEAVAFVFELKAVLHDVLAPALESGGHQREYRGLLMRVDDAGLAAFDVYLGCREKIWELKAAMMRDRSYKLMERAGLLWEENGGKNSTDADER